MTKDTGNSTTEINNQALSYCEFTWSIGNYFLISFLFIFIIEYKIPLHLMWRKIIFLSDISYIHRDSKRLSCLFYFPFMFTDPCCPAEFCLPQSTNSIEGQRYCICTDSDPKTSNNQNCSKDRKEAQLYIKKKINPWINHCMKLLKFILFQKSIVSCGPKLLPLCFVLLSVVISAWHRMHLPEVSVL